MRDNVTKLDSDRFPADKLTRGLLRFIWRRRPRVPSLMVEAVEMLEGGQPLQRLLGIVGRPPHKFVLPLCGQRALGVLPPKDALVRLAELDQPV